MSSAPPPSGDGPTSTEQAGSATSLTARFLVAVGQEVGTEGVTPAALARAATRVLPVEAAGLSIIMNGLRLPLGASSDAARRAEELQTSLDEGPCLDAAHTRAPVVADLEDIEDRWPHYAEELVGRTPFRAVAAIPLQVPGRGVFAALDVYASARRLSVELDQEAVRQVATPAAALLFATLGEVSDTDATSEAGPEWYRAATQRRHDVWVAVGVIMAARSGDGQDALSLLRAHAYTQDRSLDDLAADVVAGRLPVADLLG